MNANAKEFLRHQWTLAEVAILVSLALTSLSVITYSNRIIFRLEAVERAYIQTQEKIKDMDYKRDNIRAELDEYKRENDIRLAIYDRITKEIQAELNWRKLHPQKDWGYLPQ